MKATTFLKSLTIAAAAVFFGSCQQLYVETQPEVEVKMVTDVREAYTFSGTNPQPATFSIASTTPWEVTGYEAAEWCNVKPASSALSSLSADVTISVAPNDTYEERSVTLTLKGEGVEETWTVVVTQSKKSKLFVQPINETFAGAESSKTFTIETNLAWEVRSADSWLTFDKTSGTGTGAVETITATAALNVGTERTTTVTVTAGNDVESFQVTQKGGLELEFLPVESTEVSYAGGEILLDVKSSLDWNVTSSAEWLAVEKVGDQVKVTAQANNKFAARTAKVTVVPAIDVPVELVAEIELTQDVAFEFEENCVINDDGSVTVNADAVSRVSFKEGYRYLDCIIKVDPTRSSYDDDAEFWFTGQLGNVNIYNQLTLSGNLRTRTDGDMANGESAYNRVSYADATGIDVNEELLSQMTEYRIKLYPNDANELVFEFYINGTLTGVQSGVNPYAHDPELINYWFGVYSTTSSTYYTITGCDVVSVAE